LEQSAQFEDKLDVYIYRHALADDEDSNNVRQINSSQTNSSIIRRIDFERMAGRKGKTCEISSKLITFATGLWD